MKKLFLLSLVSVLFLAGCNVKEEPTKTITPDVPTIEKEPEVYVPTDTTLSFSDENASKVSTEPTFDISQYTADAS